MCVTKLSTWRRTDILISREVDVHESHDVIKLIDIGGEDRYMIQERSGVLFL